MLFLPPKLKHSTIVILTQDFNHCKTMFLICVSGLLTDAIIPRRDAIPGCPPGLEYLTQLDKIEIHPLPYQVHVIYTYYDVNVLIIIMYCTIQHTTCT